jgi:hypothetical protein
VPETEQEARVPFGSANMHMRWAMFIHHRGPCPRLQIKASISRHHQTIGQLVHVYRLGQIQP